jgi:hypothetical protein
MDGTALDGQKDQASKYLVSAFSMAPRQLMDLSVRQGAEQTFDV